jgi:hypothetical protein
MENGPSRPLPSDTVLDELYDAVKELLRTNQARPE